MSYRFIAALTVVLAFVQAAPSTAGSRLLDDQSIRALFPGRYIAQIKGGYSISINAKSNGTLKGTAILGISDKGRWTVRRRTLCIAFKKWTKGKPKCGMVRKSGQWYVVASRGKEKFRFKKRPARLASR